MFIWKQGVRQVVKFEKKNAAILPLILIRACFCIITGMVLYPQKKSRNAPAELNQTLLTQFG